MLLYGGHSYTCNKKTESSMYWVCRKRDICKAKLSTNVAMTSVLLQPGEHTHSGDPVENSLLAVRDHMKAKAGKRRALPFFVLCFVNRMTCSFQTAKGNHQSY